MAQSLNGQLHNRALQSIAGGVNSPVRAFGSVDMPPIFIQKAKGPYIYDADGKEYIDLLMSWGAIILGHCDEDVNNAVIEAVTKGSSFGLCHENEAKLAELIKQAFPSIELLRMVSSGTEAVMSAVRLARAYTGKDKIIKFEGCYHGHSDEMLSNAGSGLATLSIPASKGVTSDAVRNILTAQLNDLVSVENLLNDHHKNIAAIIIEPVAGNIGVIPPKDGFLQGLRKICDQTGALLIFDEVITGFRVAFGGAQEKYNVKPDITTLGKIIGGGFPCAAFGGRRDVMEMLAPLGQTYQAGTLSGNPVAVTAGKTVIEKLIKLNPYNELETNTKYLSDKIKEHAKQLNLPVQVNRAGSMFTVFFSKNEIKTYSDLKNIDVNVFKNFFKESISNGILIPPSPYESSFLSLAHNTKIINKLESIFSKAVDAIRVRTAQTQDKQSRAE